MSLNTEADSASRMSPLTRALRAGAAAGEAAVVKSAGAGTTGAGAEAATGVAGAFAGGMGSGLARGTKSASSVFSRSSTKSVRTSSVDFSLEAVGEALTAARETGVAG